VAVLAVIACGIGYAAYQYEQLNPKPKVQTAAHWEAKHQKNHGSFNQTAMTQIGLTDIQKQQIETIKDDTTNTRTMRKQIAKVLTEDQRKQLKELRAQEQAARKQAMETRKARKARMLGASADYERAADKVIAANRQQKKALAQNTRNNQGT